MTDYEQWFEDALDETSARLTEPGQARRAVMRQSLQGAVTARRRRRTATRWGGTALAMALLGVIWWQATPEVQLPAPGAPAVAALQYFEYQVVANDETVLERYRAPERTVSADTLVGDEELMELLAAAGRPTGLIRTGGRLIVTEEVTDPVGE